MLEIYKEVLYDLLMQGAHKDLKIKESKKIGIYVQGLTQIELENKDDLLSIMNMGYNQKQTKETRLNEYSSRSHTIFTIEIN